MRIDSRFRAQSFDVLPFRDLAPKPPVEEVHARGPQSLEQNPALQAFRGESGFDGAEAVQPLQQNPALRAFQGESGFDGVDAVQSPKEQGGEVNGPPGEPLLWQFVELPEWFKVLLGIK